ncbi:MAG: monovalent cation/H+ antiporter complex subunit F [Oscillospiraceae bacterium]|nr:monovalent cation/H+ antiporter complex subunit F [Oscillospiraceae bacterium]
MYILWIMIGFMTAYAIRAIMGPSIWDRLLGMNLVSTKIIIIIAVYASIQERAYFLDFAMIYALSGFIGIIFIAFFLERQRGGKK